MMIAAVRETIASGGFGAHGGWRCQAAWCSWERQKLRQATGANHYIGGRTAAVRAAQIAKMVLAS